MLMCPFLKEEVRSAIWGLNGDGAPNLNGLPIVFYRDYWDVVQTKVMTDIELFCPRGVGVKHGLYQPLTHRLHSQVSGGSGYWGFLADLPIQLVITDPGKAPSNLVVGKY